MVVTCCNTDINPSFCEHADYHGTNAFVGTGTFCTRKYEIAVCILCVLLLCVCHYAHQVVCQLIHPNKLQMDLHALALMELKRLSKRRRSTNFMATKAMKVRFSKTTKMSPENFDGEGSSTGLQWVWQNVSKWGRTVVDNYQRKLSSFTLLNRGYNDKDVYITEQYLFELETRRHSILEQTAGVAARGYYFESTHNDSMIELDYNYDEAGVDENKQDVLGLLDVNALENSHDGDNDDDDDDDDDVLLHERLRDSEAMKELEECEESESSVVTTVLSNDHDTGSKRPSLRSNSSQTAMSVNSLSRSPDKASIKHDARMSVSVHDDNDDEEHDHQEPANEEKASHYVHEGHKQRGLSYSLQIESPNDATRRNMTRAVIPIELNGGGASTASPPPKILFDTPSRVQDMYGDMAAALSYKSFSMYSMNGSDAPQPPSPLHELNQNGITPTPPPPPQSDRKKESTIFVQEEDATGKAFYVHCGTPFEDDDNAAAVVAAINGTMMHRDRNDFDSACSTQTFIAKSSEDEDDELEEEMSATQTFPCVDNAENVTDNVSCAEFNAVTPATVSDELDTCKSKPDSMKAMNMGNSFSTMDSGHSAALSMTLTVASADFDSLLPSVASGSPSVCVPPTQPSMSAPLPMMRRRHSYGDDSHNWRSRTDLQLDASGDETTSGSDDNDALESSSGGGGGMDEAELVCSPYGAHNANSSQGSTPSPIKHVAPRSDDIYSELQQRKSAMDQHYCVSHRYRAYMLWYFGVAIAVMATFIVFAGPIALDHTRKYVSIPSYRDRYSFLSEACRHNGTLNLHDAYFMRYGHEFVDTTYYARNNDAVHWLLLSVISVSAMFVVYPLMLLVLAGFMMYRYRYYQRRSVDPAFLCKCCPLYQRYSSPNAPNLTAILDPNNLYFFNHTTASSNASPNRAAQKALATVPDHRAVDFEHDGDGMTTGDELDHVVNSEEEHLMGKEPPSPVNSGDDAKQEECNLQHKRVLSDVLREALLLQPVSIPMSPKHNVSGNVIVEELDENECKFMD
eukprot:CAMPEP_0202733616 /NCGR_PEP_ID=MMETSP1385-20130828/188260_1 /ASSEMBLY_ACC=CAM_ASM_000861 /TAXON_ID=933848 /ORGANISM="Elphidium margaritaceum" /LENGTH=1023 /DNA_ID=CAMNT_0049399955 /DNA_START=338 /DNA_END=3409 /DNA_ORIENTATION=-